MNLRNKSILTLEDLRADQIAGLLKLAAELKAAKEIGNEVKRLDGKNIALIFEKDSTRTRAGFEVAAYDQGAHVTYLGPSGSHIGHKETIKDTARVLGRMYDAIEFRGYAHKAAEKLARYAGVPVYNGLTDSFHPTQVLADLLTMSEHSVRPLSQMKVVFMGDIGNNVARSLALGVVKMGMEMWQCGPKSLQSARWIRDEMERTAENTDGQYVVTEDVDEAVKQADFIYTDVWLSMGDGKDSWERKIELLMPYQVNRELMNKTGNEATKFLHCLPAFHNADTEVSRDIQQKFGIDAMEVTEDVFESRASVVFDQAENRMHTIKAMLVATLGS